MNLKKVVLKKPYQFFETNDKTKNFGFLRILDHIQKDSVDARDGINKSVTTI